MLAPEIIETPVELTPMTAGADVVADYQSTGLTLRQHPLAFLRGDLDRMGMITAAKLADTKDGRRVNVAGLVLVRQRPGSAAGVLFVTLEDETAIANLIVWPDVFEANRRVILSASMLGVRGRLQKEGEVIHVIVEEMTNLAPLLQSVGGRDAGVLPVPHGRGDQATHPGGPDSREEALGGRKARDMFVRDLKLGSGIKVPTRDFR